MLYKSCAKPILIENFHQTLILILSNPMGTKYCLGYQQQQLLVQMAKQKKTVANAPTTKYALRMKNKFPPLTQQIEQILAKHQIVDLNEIIRDSPIYYIYEKQAVYQGHWDQGLPHGYGRILYKDFSYYQGLVVEGDPNTYITQTHHQDGLYIFPDGSFYLGQFRNAMFQGKGRLLIKEGQFKVVGTFKNGLPHGRAIQQFGIANEQYEGQFQNGLKSGRGKYYVADRLVYQGLFKDGNMHGDGRLINYNGSAFVGKFQDGKRKEGQLQSIMGKIKVGSDVNKEDQGYYEWNDGKFYVGGFKNGMLHGNGTIYHLNGRIIQGEWLKGHNKVVTMVSQKSQKQIVKLKQEFKKKYYLQLTDKGGEVKGLQELERRRGFHRFTTKTSKQFDSQSEYQTQVRIN